MGNYKKDVFKILSTIVMTGVLLSLTGTNAFAVTNSSSIVHHAGPIASINGDWILAGQWMGYFNPSNLTEAGFLSAFHMVMKDGSSPHMHKIYNATATEISQEGNNTIIKGTSSVTMRDGPIHNVDTTWTGSNNNTLSISMDPSKIDNHFGDTPIYGVIVSPESGMELVDLILSESDFMEKWMPMVMEDMMNSMNMIGGSSNGENNTSGPAPLLNQSMMMELIPQNNSK